MLTLHRSLPSSNIFPKGCVLTIGNFDGVHIGHQALIDRVMAEAKSSGIPPVLMTFDPTPTEFFGFSKARIMNLRSKVNQLRALGIEHVFLLRFDQTFSKLSHEHFLQVVLLQKLNIKKLIIGDDFRFGYQRKGDIEFLRVQSAEKKFEVIEIPGINADNNRISSGYLRNLLEEGNFELASQYLGEPYALTIMANPTIGVDSYCRTQFITRLPSFVLHGTYQATAMKGEYIYPCVAVLNEVNNHYVHGSLYSYVPIIESRHPIKLAFIKKIRQDDSLNLCQGGPSSIKDDLEQLSIIQS